MLALLSLTLLGAVPLCPPGASVHREVSASIELLICQTPQGVRDGVTQLVVDGRVVLRTAYRAGKKDGEERSIYRSGVVGTIARYREDRRHGLQEEFREDGRKIYEQEFRDGVAQGVLRRFHADGTRLVESEWRDDAPIRFTVFHPNGAIRATAERGLPDTVVVERDPQGAITATTRFTDGVIEGSPGVMDGGQLSCPRATFDRVRALGFSYSDRPGDGGPALVTRTETFAWGPRTSIEALKKLDCTFTVLAFGDVGEREHGGAWFHALARDGNGYF